MGAIVRTANPLWPAAYDLLWNGLMVLVSGLMLAALLDVMRTATFLRAIEWVVLIVLVPVAGPMIWFAYGRRRFTDE
ncbi:MAG TPA: PLDc N-terminal domain-containing protein [Actinotalea sp.]|jgi:hypothetical protein